MTALRRQLLTAPYRRHAPRHVSLAPCILVTRPLPARRLSLDLSSLVLRPSVVSPGPLVLCPSTTHLLSLNHSSLVPISLVPFPYTTHPLFSNHSSLVRQPLITHPLSLNHSSFVPQPLIPCPANSHSLSLNHSSLVHRPLVVDHPFIMPAGFP